MAMLGGSVILFYGLLESNFIFALEGIIMIWIGFGIFTTVLQIQNNVHQE